MRISSPSPYAVSKFPTLAASPFGHGYGYASLAKPRLMMPEQPQERAASSGKEDARPRLAHSESPRSAKKTFSIHSRELQERIRLSVLKACPQWLAHEKEDLSQRALLRLMERASKEPDHDGFCATYIYRTAHNTVIDEVRKRRREVLVDDPEPALNAELTGEPDQQKESPSSQIRNSRLRQSIFHCLGKIRKERRIAISLKLQGHSTADIGALLDWNNKRVENMTSRGRQDLRVCLEKKGLSGSCQA